MFITRLFDPLFLFAPDEPAGGGEVPTEATPEAPTADQPEAPTPDAPEAPAAGTSETETPETPDAETPDEAFTDVNADDLPEDVKARYQQMQADYTRKTQALAERNSELDAVQSFAVDLLADELNDTQEAVFRTLAEKLGYELEGDDEPNADAEEGDEPETETPQFHDPRLDPILAEREEKARADAEAAREAELDAAEQAIDNGILELAKADGIELSEEEQALIFSDVLALPPVNDGPNVQGAYDRYKAAAKAYTDRWVKSKGATQAPGGEEAAKPVNLNNEQERIAHMARNIEAARRAQTGL